MELSFIFEDVIFDVLDLGRAKTKKIVQNHHHGRGTYEIHYIIDGKGYMEVHGKHYEMKKGAFFFTGPYIEHSNHPDLQEGAEQCLLFLYCKNESKEPLTQSFQHITFWYGQDQDELGQLMQTLVQEQEDQLLGYKKRMQLLLSDLIIQLVRRYYANSNLKKSTMNDDNIDRTSLLIDKTFLSSYNLLTLESLSKVLNCSPRQTQRLLKTYYNKNFQQKRCEARMIMACTMLKQTNMTLCEIAEKLGYSSLGHFSNAFQKYYGIRPSAYRKQP